MPKGVGCGEGCPLPKGEGAVPQILTNRMSDHLFRILCGRQKGYFPM